MASTANRLGQLLLTGKSAQFTHVAICMVPDVLLDARPFDDIRLRNVFEEVRLRNLDSARMSRSDILVLRNTALTTSHEAMDATTAELLRPLYPQLRKKYNWFFRRPQTSDKNPAAADAQRAFCSELCVLMLHYLNVLPGSWESASKTFPVHFQELLSSGWSDITDEWSAELQSVQQAINASRSERGQIIMPRKEAADLWIKETEGWANLQETLDTLVNDMSTKFDDLLARMKQQL